MEKDNEVVNTKESDLLSSFKFLYDNEGLYFENIGKVLHLFIYSPSLIRVRYRSGIKWERDFSYAIDLQEAYNHNDTLFVIQDNLDNITIETALMSMEIDKRTLLITMKDRAGLVLSKDHNLEYHVDYEQGICKITYTKMLIDGEHIYGLGDKSCTADLRGRAVEVWGTDNYGFESWNDPLYKNIPFYISLHNSQSYGVFIDNPYRIDYNIGQEDNRKLSIKIDGGELNYYFIYGPQMLEVTRQYTLLTGVPELPPLWSLGYQQSKWSYYPASNVYDLAHKLRTHRIPCDVIYLDIDYMDGFRCFTWDAERFPDPKQLVQDLKVLGFKTVVIIDPGIKIDKKYSIYNEGIQNQYFVKGGEGGLIEGMVWPGACHFPDFTDPRVREWWKGLFRELVEDIGIDGVWNDMNEPALFEVPNKSFPNTARHNYDGDESSHRRVHNVYGMQMTRATYEGVKKYNNGKRPFILTRSTYAGGQRFSAGWTGDNKASWEHISIANIQAQRLSICGFSFVGADIGGFIDQPSAELFTRWIAAAIFHPFFRNHSSGDHGNQEPWAFDEETLDKVRNFIELRYTFLPYIYTAFYRYVRDGTPMLMPSYMYDQADMHTHYRSDEVMLGNDVLFAPVYEEGVTQKMIYLPKGEWYNYYDESYYIGNKEYLVPAPIDQACIFIKAGAILPIYPIMNFVGEKSIEELTVKVYFQQGHHEAFFLYEDSGEGYEYKNGQCNEVTICSDMSSDQIKINQIRKGKFTPTYRSYLLRIIGLPSVIDGVNVDGVGIDYHPNGFACDFDFNEIIINLA